MDRRRAGALREDVERRMVRAPGVADALSARVAEDAGFDTLYVSGGAVARSLGVPDVGLVGASDMVRRVGEIASVTRAALVVDADTGYGGALACARAVEALARAGAAAVHIEDQADPKRCAEYGGVRLADPAEARARIRAAAMAGAGEILVIARTDAMPVAGRQEAVDRACAYVGAGADLVFVEGVHDAKDIEVLAASTGRPLLLNAADLVRAAVGPAQAERLGCRLLIFPADLQKAAIRAMRRMAETLAQDDPSRPPDSLLATDAEREAVVRRDALAAFERAAYGPKGDAATSREGR